MICGIDLGTTYSLIGHGDTIYSGLVASAVDLNTKQQVDIDFINPDVIHSYKVDMTTGDSGKLPIACSSIVLMELANIASRKTGEEIKDVVISVPAKFTATQRKATWLAAEHAGLNPRGLINEPTAAALYACKSYKDLIIVYDLGGGTFDVTILDARTGQYYVVASDGNGKLAGDNLDRAIAQLAMNTCKVKIMNKTKQNLLKLYNACRHAKENITTYSDKEYIQIPEMELSFELTRDKYIEVMHRVFQPTVDLTKQVIANNLLECDKPKLLFVGGSTADKYLRDWVSSELGLEEFPQVGDPSYIVAKGVAMYAEMVETGQAEVEITDVTTRLSVGLSTGLTETIIEENSAIPTEDSYIAVNSDTTNTLTINLYQGEGVTVNDVTYIGTLCYDYGRTVEAGKGIVDIGVAINRDGVITLSATDLARNNTQKIDLHMGDVK